jgi:hypothetical protein
VDKEISLLEKGISAVDLPQWKPRKEMSAAGKPPPERDKYTSETDRGLSDGDQDFSPLQKDMA